MLAGEQGSWFALLFCSLAELHSALRENTVIPALPANEVSQNVTALPSSLSFTAAAWRFPDTHLPAAACPAEGGHVLQRSSASAGR